MRFWYMNMFSDSLNNQNKKNKPTIKKNKKKQQNLKIYKHSNNMYTKELMIFILIGYHKQ